MPHSIASFQRKLEHQSDAFLYDLKIKLWCRDKHTLKAFYETMAALKNAPSEVVYKSINACLRKYPQFCNRVVGFYSDGRLKLKDNATPKIITNIPPARFSDDILTCIVPLLPYPLLGRLAKTCTWMNAHITDEMVENALARAREHFGKTMLLYDEPGDRNMLHISSTEDEMIAVGRLSPGSSICILRTQDRRTFLGISHDMGVGPTGRFAVLSDVIAHATVIGPDTPSVWFKRTAYNVHRESMDLTFIMIRDGDVYSAHCCMQFEEFVM